MRDIRPLLDSEGCTARLGTWSGPVGVQELIKIMKEDFNFKHSVRFNYYTNLDLLESRIQHTQS